MKPQYDRTWAKAALIYLGGVGRFDLWYEDDGTIRIVWGILGPGTWHWVHVGDDGTLNLSSLAVSGLRDGPNEEEVIDITRYLALFAPDMGVRLAEG